MKIKELSLHLNNSRISDDKSLGNKGFSLVELIVVITIMVIFVAIAVVSSSVIDSSRVKEVERGIDDFANMARAKSMSVAAKEWYMELTTVDGEYVTYIYKVEVVELSDGSEEYKHINVDGDVYNDSVTVTFNDGNSVTTIKEDSELRIYFDAATGKVKKITIGDDEDGVDISGGIGLISIKTDVYESTLKFFYNTGKIERE